MNRSATARFALDSTTLRLSSGDPTDGSFCLQSTDDPIRIDPAIPGDADFFRTLRAEVMGPYWRAHPNLMQIPESPAGRTRPEFFRSEDTRIVTVGTDQVAALQVIRYDAIHSLRWLLVTPRHQGRGIGTALVRLVQREASDLSCDVTLDVLHANSRARDLYERLGFKVKRVGSDLSVMHWSQGTAAGQTGDL